MSDEQQEAAFWRGRYEEVEAILASTFRAVGESLTERAKAQAFTGVSDIWVQQDGEGRVTLTGLIAGPLQEVRFLVSRAGQSVVSMPFGFANTVTFQAPATGRYSVHCETRIPGEEELHSRQWIEVMVA